METWLVGIVNLLIGFALAFVPRWFDRRRRLLSYWKVLREEIQYCQGGGLGLEKAGITAPLGRLPTEVYDEVFKHIVGEGDIEPAESRSLMRYYDLVSQVNRSLDISAAAVEREGRDSARAKEEFGRTVVKARRFAPDHEERYYASVIEIVNRRCNRSLLKF